MSHPTRIMYIENKGGDTIEQWWGSYSLEANLTGPARIERVTFSKTGRSLTYRGKSFTKATDFKANYVCESGEWFWISGPKKRGGDSLYATNIPMKSMTTFAKSIGQKFESSRNAKLRNTPRK